MKRARTAAEIAKLARRSRRSYCISANGTTQPGRSLRLRYVARLAKRVAVLDEKLSRCCGLPVHVVAGRTTTTLIGSRLTPP
jgi:hypothetical protein